MGLSICGRNSLEINDEGPNITKQTSIPMTKSKASDHSIKTIANKVSIIKNPKSNKNKFVNKSFTINKREKLIEGKKEKTIDFINYNNCLNNYNQQKLRLNSYDYSPINTVIPESSLNEKEIVIIHAGKMKIKMSGKYTDFYEHISIIGKGAYGEVFKVRSILNNKLYALKTIPKRVCINQIQVLEEIEILKTLDHPNILRIYEYFQDNMNYYLLTE